MKLPVILIFTLLFNYGYNAKLSSLLPSQPVSGSHILQYFKYLFLPNVNSMEDSKALQLNQPIELSVGWSRTVTIVENSFGQVIHKFIEYEFSLQSTVDVHSVKEHVIDVYNYKDKIVKEKVSMYCDPGPCHNYKIAIIRVNSKRLTIDIQPNIETIKEILSQFGVLKTDVQAIIDMIFNPDILADQVTLANTIISLTNKYLYIENDNVIVTEISPLPNYYGGLIKYIDENGEIHCFSQHGLELKPALCPAEISSITEINLESDTSIPFKYIDKNGNVLCFNEFDNELKQIACPADSLLLPTIDIKKSINDNGVQYCTYTKGTQVKQTVCPASMNEEVMDQENVFLDHNEEVMDKENVVLDHSDDTNLVKYVDPNGNVHCFAISDEHLTERTCPLDYSLLPEVNIVKYVDDNGVEYCSFSMKDIVTHFACPSSLSMVPLTPKPKLQNAITKYVDSQGNVHCYDHNGNEFGEIVCPTETSNLPVFNPYKKLYKYVDASGKPHCFYKSENGDLLEPTNCPNDLSQVADLSLKDGHVIPFKHIGPDGRVHCFEMSAASIMERRCPENILLLPEKNIFKFVDEDGVEHCYMKEGNKNVHVHCPRGQNNLFLSQVEDLSDILVKYIDANGQIHCYKKTLTNFEDTVCPEDTSNLPVVNPYKDYIKYVDDNGEHCFKEHGMDLEAVQCPSDTSRIPERSLNTNNKNIRVKYVDPSGKVHCYDVSDEYLTEMTCTSDYSTLPEVNIVKYLGDDGIEYCSFSKNGVVTHFACPSSLSTIPLTPNQNLQNAITKYVDPQGNIHCYDHNDNEFSEIVCPTETSNLPVFNPYKKLYKYVDANGIPHCFYKSKNEDLLEPTNCPNDLSQVADLSLEDGHVIPIKHIGPDGRVHCFDMNAGGKMERQCPENTSLLPEKNILKFVDEDGVEHCYFKEGNRYEHTHCPRGQNNLLLTSVEDLSGILVKNIDANGQIHCYKKTVTNFEATECPEDVSNLPVLNPYKDYIKNANDEGKPCFEENGMKGVQCQSNKNDIPVHSLNTNNDNRVKYVDPSGKVHCYDINNEYLTEISCPSDYLLLPDVNIVKYKGDNGVEYCSFSIKDIVTHFACPSSLSTIPLTPKPKHQNAITKYVDSEGNVHCYDHNGNDFSEIVCPTETSNVPVINPYKKLYKYVDASGKPHCFYRSENGDLLEPTNCPNDHSQVADLSLKGGHEIPIKHIGPDGREHCFDMSAAGMTERRCPENNSLLPEKNIFKFVDEDGVEHCYMKEGNRRVHVNCPRGQNNLFLSQVEDLSDILVKYIDANGQIHCYKKTLMNFEETVCPEDTSNLPVVNPYKDYIKYVDGNKQYCFKEHNKDLEPVQCPSDTSGIPERSLNTNNNIPVKYTDSNGMVHCFDISYENIIEKKCPPDYSLLPEIDIVKYADDHGSQYCSFNFNDNVVHFACPNSLSMVPLTPIQNLQNVISKYVDPEGRTHCYDYTNFEVTETICPKDTSNLPVFNPYKKFFKYVDARGKPHCFYNSENGDLLEPTNCPSDLSQVTDLSLEDGNVIPIKHIGPDGRVHCFEMSAASMIERRCPENILLLPEKNIFKFVDEDGVEHCYMKEGNKNVHAHCPRGQNNLFLSQVEDLSDILVKYIDANGQIHCYKKILTNFEETVCPEDTSNLPVVNPYKDYIKYVDGNKQYCFKEHNMDLEAVQCPSDTSGIPERSLNTNNNIPVKYTDSNGIVHCFDISYENIIERKCPPDYLLLPEVDIVKYIDDYGSQYCSFNFNDNVVHFACPNSLSMIPLTPTQNIKNMISKYIDPEGRVHCYDYNNSEVTETACPKDTSNLPVFNPYKNFFKYLDVNGIPHCFYKNENADLLEPTKCPRDLLNVAELPLDNGHVVPIKQVGSDNKVHCFDMTAAGKTERSCSGETPIIPMQNIVKFVDENGVEKCYLKVGNRNKQIHCPVEQKNLLLTPIDKISDIIVKNIDAHGVVRCYKKIEMNFEETICPRDTSLLPEVSFITKEAPNKRHQTTKSSPLRDILFGMNKGKDFSPNGSGEVKLTYDELALISKLMCKEH